MNTSIQQLVIQEQADLKDRMDKLAAYLTTPEFAILTATDQTLLLRQQAVMSAYEAVLVQRISLFPKRYQCFKQVMATPMTRGEYNVLQGWTLPADQNGNDAGYLVEYQDGISKPNHPNYTGYISWSPADVFVAGYKEIME